MGHSTTVVILLAFSTIISCKEKVDSHRIEPPRNYAAGDSQTVKSLCFSPDGATLVLGGQNKKVKIIRISDGAELWVSGIQPDAVLVVGFSPDGRYVVSTCGDNTENTAQVVVFDAAEKSELWGIRKMTNDVQCAEFSPDSKALAIANYFSIALYESDSGKQKNFFSGHSIDVTAPSGHVGAVSDMVFTKDSKSLVTVGWDRSVKIWDLISGRETKTYPEADPINACLLSPTEDRILTASVDAIHVWNLARNMTDTVLAYAGEIQALCWIKGGQYFVSGDQNGDLAVWKYADWSLVARFENVHPQGVWGLAASSDGEQVASSGGNGRITIWDSDYLLLTKPASDSLSDKDRR